MKKKLLIWIIAAGFIVLVIIESVEQPPISIRLHRLVPGGGEIMTLTNTSDKTLHNVKVRAFNPETHGTVNRIVAVALEPNRSIDVSWMEFDPGEDYSISARGYFRKISDTAPKP